MKRAERALNEAYVHLTQARAEVAMAEVWLGEVWARHHQKRLSDAADNELRWIELDLSAIKEHLDSAITRSIEVRL